MLANVDIYTTNFKSRVRPKCVVNLHISLAVATEVVAYNIDNML